MAELNKRPRIRSIDFEIKDAGNTRNVKAQDLNDVLRGVLIDIRNAWGLSTRALSARLGVRQQTISGFLDADLDQGTRVDTLSRLCGAMDMGVADLFALHPQYKSTTTNSRAWAMVKNSLDQESQERFLEAVLVGAQMGVLPGMIANLNDMVVNLAKAQGIDTGTAKKQAKQMATG